MKVRKAALFLIWIALCGTPVMARGDKVITLVADGVGGDGTVFRTKIDIINLGPFDPITGDKVKIQFFLQNGTPWSIATDRGTASEFGLDLAPFETTRFQTQGVGSLTSGYAIIRNIEPDVDRLISGTNELANFAEDFEVSPSVFYEIRKGADVIDTVSVPIGQRTRHWQLPVENDTPRNLLTGLAILNMSGETNQVSLNLYRAKPSPSNPDATATLSLGPNEQKSEFLVQGLFPSSGVFRGMIEGTSDKPVTVVALLQTPTPTGVQYATLAPAYIEAMRRNTNLYLPQGSALDVDLLVSDYFADITGRFQDTDPWDLTYGSSGGTTRRLTPQPGVQFSVIGVLLDNNQNIDLTAFDNLSLDQLQNRNYSSDSIDMSDNSSNAKIGFTFAVKTSLGQYAKVLVFDLIRVNFQSGATALDLALEAYTFK